MPAQRVHVSESVLGQLHIKLDGRTVGQHSFRAFTNSSYLLVQLELSINSSVWCDSDQAMVSPAHLEIMLSDQRYLHIRLSVVLTIRKEPYVSLSVPLEALFVLA